MKAAKANGGKRRGVVLMEVLLAIGIFAMSATAFAVALHKTAEASIAAHRRIQINRILRSALTEALSQPQLQEDEFTVTLDERIGGELVDIKTLIEPMTEIENMDGQLLQEMFRIEVVARWYEDGDWQEESAETWRYARLYVAQ